MHTSYSTLHYLPEQVDSASGLSPGALLHVCRHWKFRMARAFETQQHKPGAANPYGSTERLQPLHRDKVAMRLPCHSAIPTRDSPSRPTAGH